jgi:hypothetical protein
LIRKSQCYGQPNHAMGPAGSNIFRPHSTWATRQGGANLESEGCCCLRSFCHPRNADSRVGVCCNRRPAVSFSQPHGPQRLAPSLFSRYRGRLSSGPVLGGAPSYPHKTGKVYTQTKPRVKYIRPLLCIQHKILSMSQVEGFCQLVCQTSEGELASGSLRIAWLFSPKVAKCRNLLRSIYGQPPAGEGN